jgi:hypothetical protein
MILVCVVIVVALLILGVRNGNVISQILRFLIAVGAIAAVATLLFAS